MADKELKIEITAGGNAAAETEKVSESLKHVTKGTEAATEGTRLAGKAAEESGISHRELRRVLDDIGNVVAPGAGRALAELAMGPARADSLIH